MAICDCASDRRILINSNESFHPASTFKICVMMEVFHQAQQGLFSLDEPVIVKNKFLSIADQSEFSLNASDDSETDLYNLLNHPLTIRELVTRMITHSSNLATNILVELVTPRKVTSFMGELGASGLVVRRGVEDNKAFALGLNNSATARAFMQILTKLAVYEVVSQNASEAMIAIMKQQIYNEGIPASLPAAVTVAHKTGWNGLLYHDAAIIYPPNQDPYVLVIMTRGLSDESEGPAFVSALSKWIYDSQAEWRK
jgi:beta-lactamase class A